MNEMTVFQNPDFGAVRSLTLDGDPWFVGKDVASALGYRDSVNALKAHVDVEDKRGWQITTPKGQQQATIINESGLYSLILSSKLPDAKKFKRWVTSEILPAIRKTGQYAPQNVVDRLTPDDYIRAASIVAKCNDRRLPVAISLLEKAGIDISILNEFQTTQTDAECGRVTNDDMEHLQSVLRRYKVREAARLVGLSPALISFYRRGQRRPKKERYDMMMEILK